MDNISFKITGDGSHTLYVNDLGETYHSINGAIQESKHIFINSGFNYIKQTQFKILEVGFGTGLNAFLSLLECIKTKTKVDYTTLEVFPLSNEIIVQLNYSSELKSTPMETESFHLLHQVAWERYQKITPNFQLKKKKVELNNYQTTEQFDLIYFDAFAPQVQSEMWTKPVFEKMYNLLSDGGILVTYCAKGSVKRTLKEVGFTVENLPGPPGKREITRALKL